MSNLTSLERWLALFAGEKPDRIPTDYWATTEVTSQLLKELRCSTAEELYLKLHIDAIYKIGPNHPVPPRLRDKGMDIWGLKRKWINYGAGEYNEVENHPLASAKSVQDVNNYPWPSSKDCDFDTFRMLLADAPSHRIVETGDYEPFLLYSHLRGMEQALIDLLEAPDIAHAALEHIFEYYFEVNQRAFEIGKHKIDLTYIAEDLGSQKGLLMGMDQIREFFLPNQKCMADLARSYGIHIFYHSDGDIREAIPRLISITGIEVLNPIQWRCPSMERHGLVRDFGKTLIFHGAMDNQKTLPFGTIEDVRSEVLENIEIFKNARWICAPCHNIQPITPSQNIITMYETIHEYGKL
jgi:uroporphyrinogen decarboxylase